jgi:Pyruvate/2-oxoacid:ferredoxin oxidoreductase delta subunit
MVEEKIKKDFLKLITLYIRFISKRDKNLNFIKRVKPIHQIFKLFSPAYDVCKKCDLTWKHCKEKSIATDKFTHVFATCYYCWGKFNIR